MDSDSHAVELIFICTLAEGATPGLGSAPDTKQIGLEWLPLVRLDSYRLYPLGLRASIARHDDPGVPVYLGDIN